MKIHICLSLLFLVGQNIPSTKKINIPSSTKSLKTTYEQPQPVTYVWAGKEYTVYPDASTSSESIEPVVENKLTSKSSSSIFLPRQLKQNSSGTSNYSSTFSAKRSNSNSDFSYVDESSYTETISKVRTKISSVSLI